MAFKKGKRACLVIKKSQYKAFKGALLSAGYEFHIGPRTIRKGEIDSMVASVRSDRQVHVRAVRRRDGDIAVYAHTEPSIDSPVAHALAALTDDMSFQGGARALLNDLRQQGWDV